MGGREREEAVAVWPAGEARMQARSSKSKERKKKQASKPGREEEKKRREDETSRVSRGRREEAGQGQSMKRDRQTDRQTER